MLAALIILLLISLFVLLWHYRKERKMMGRRTVELIGDDLWKDIETEREESIERGKKFRQILEQMKKR